MLFDIKAKRYECVDGKIYIEFAPYNDELKDLLYNGGTYDILDNSIEYTVNYYKPIVREELYNLLPEDIKSGYTNSQFKITNSIDDPTNINYDIFGLHKYEYIEMTDINRKGELYKIEYYRNLSGNPNSINSYSDLVLVENRVYTRDPNSALIVSRNQTTEWYLTDETIGATKTTTKYYQLKDSIQEGISRRDNITAFAKLYLLSHIGLANGQILITDLTPYISTYLQGNHQPLLDAVANSTESFMTPTIKATTVSILTF